MKMRPDGYFWRNCLVKDVHMRSYYESELKWKVFFKNNRLECQLALGHSSRCALQRDCRVTVPCYVDVPRGSAHFCLESVSLG